MKDGCGGPNRPAASALYMIHHARFFLDLKAASEFLRSQSTRAQDDDFMFLVYRVDL